MSRSRIRNFFKSRIRKKKIRIHKTAIKNLGRYLILGYLIGDGPLLLLPIVESVRAAVVRILHHLLLLQLLLLLLNLLVDCLLALLDGLIELHRHPLVPGERVQVGVVLQLAFLCQIRLVGFSWRRKPDLKWEKTLDLFIWGTVPCARTSQSYPFPPDVKSNNERELR